MTLSMIIPVYNVERYLPACLDSIARQSLDDYEVIVVDDGSTDASGRICDDYAGRDSRITVIHQQNQGLSSARNTGMRHANGRYFFFVDSDDFLVPEALPRVLTHALESDADIAGFNTISGERNALETTCGNINNARCSASEVMTGDEYIATHNYLTTVWWYIVKRQHVQQLGLTFPVGRCVEDASFTPFVLLHARRAIHVECTVYCYVHQPGSIMHNNDWQRQFNMLADYAFAARNLTDERSQGLYPFAPLYKVDYPGAKFTLLHWLMNRPLLWQTLSLPFKLK